MKTEKYYLILGVVTGILSVSALARVELPLPTDESFLIGLSHPELAWIERLNVIVVPPDSEPNKNGLVWKELQAKIESKLKEAGIKIVDAIEEEDISRRSLGIPDLRVDIDMLKLKDLQQYVFHIQTSFARSLNLFPSQARLTLIKSDVWKARAVMQVVSVENMPAEVTNVVLEQVETFICAYVVANPPDKQPADARTTDTVSQTAQRQQAKPAAKPAVAKYKYVASKNSKVFHKPECSSAKRILPKNLVGYNGRDEALKAGKRPCKICKP